MHRGLFVSRSRNFHELNPRVYSLYAFFPWVEGINKSSWDFIAEVWQNDKTVMQLGGL